MEPSFGELHIFILHHRCKLGPTCCQDEQKLSIQSHTTLLLYIVASHKTLKNVCSIRKFALGFDVEKLLTDFLESEEEGPTALVV